MIDGIVLAGGFSSRVKQNKMTLKLGGKELILHTISRMKTVCENIVVVTGHYHEELKELLKNEKDVTVCENKDYESGMFSSVKAGVSYVKNNFLIIPGDCPMVKPDTLKKILSGTKKIRVPSYKMHLGHPIYIDLSLKDEILSDKYNNLKAFRNAHDFEYIEVDDQNILLDVDTMKDFNLLKERIDSVGN